MIADTQGKAGSEAHLLHFILPAPNADTFRVRAQTEYGENAPIFPGKRGFSVFDHSGALLETQKCAPCAPVSKIG